VGLVYPTTVRQRITLLWVNSSQLPTLGGQLATIGQGEFKKPVYESKFMKLAEMSFLNSKPGAFLDLGKQDFSGRGDERYLPPS
jgi:hypothetical protein